MLSIQPIPNRSLIVALAILASVVGILAEAIAEDSGLAEGKNAISQRYGSVTHPIRVKLKITRGSASPQIHALCIRQGRG